LITKNILLISPSDKNRFILTDTNFELVKGRLKYSEYNDIQNIISLDEIYNIIKSIENDSTVLVSIGNELVEISKLNEVSLISIRC
jgi:hypothetical protein